MKKSFIALAVAGAVAAPLTANAVDVTYGGFVEMDLYLSSSATTGNEKTEDLSTTDTVDSGAYIDNGDVNFSVSAIEDVGFAEAFAGFRLDLDGNSNDKLDSLDSVAVGLKGSFGTVTLGEGTEYAASGQLAGDLIISNPGVDKSLSYEAPVFVPGLTVGLNLVTTTYAAGTVTVREATATTDAVTATADTETSGLGFGAAYSADLGSAGSIDFGFGQRSIEQSVRANIDKSSGDASSGLNEVGSASLSYQSLGLKYSVAGFHVAFAQQTNTKEEENTNSTGETVKGEFEDAVATDIEVGFATGPIAAYLRQSSAENYNDGSVKKDTKGSEASATRIHVDYSLSDAVTASVRSSSATQSVKDQKDSESSSLYVGLALAF